jgi:hypothetical protein
MPMSNTPSLTPPLVTSGSARLLLHENVLGALFVGYKRAQPDIFRSGSMDVSVPNPPIAISKPGGGTAYLDYRVELVSFGFDIVPADQTFDGFVDPFSLSSNQVALYASIIADFRGKVPVDWSDRITVRAWLQCQLGWTEGDVSFSLEAVRVSIDQLENSSLLHIINMVLSDVLDAFVVHIKIPTSMPLGELGRLSITSLQLHLNSIDCSANLEN